MNPLIETFRERRCFVLAKLVARPDGRVDKIPCNLDSMPINAQDEANWLNGQDAADYATAFGLGVGIVISEGSGLACVDIDHAWDGTAWAPHVETILALFPGAYVEVSQSGTGLHIIFSCMPVPPHKTRCAAPVLECYTRARFIYLTGTYARGDVRTDLTPQLVQFLGNYFGDAVPSADVAWTDAPVAEWKGPDDDAELIRRATKARSVKAMVNARASFNDLWTGNVEALARSYPAQDDAYNRSGADQALANHLAFWCGKNAERMMRIFLSCDALRRDKWDRDNYVRPTILRAIADQREVYKDPRGETAVPAAPVPSESDPRSVILLVGGKLNEYAAQAESLLADTVYVRGGDLVRIGRASEIEDGAIRTTSRDAGQAVCIAASPGWLRRVLMARAQFWKYDKRSNEWEPKDCPKELSENIGDQRAWATFRTLKAITSVPILRPDLSVWTQAGYDDATGVYYQPTIQFPTIIPEPTRDDALQALARLREPFDQFPYEAPEAEAVFVSHVVASVVRASFSTSPIYLYTSPMAATGKTLLADIAAVIAQGVAHPAKNPYSEGEELRKVLFASLLAGDAALTLDNVPNGMKIRAPGLCQFATSGMYGDRVLGASETRKLPNRSTVVLNGNNITPAGDMSRRSVICRLDVNAESARGRTFRIKDLRAHVRERRAQCIVDALTIVRAYAFAGRPEVAHPLESFEEWSRLARDPLVWLGMADPVASQLTQSEDDVTPLRTAFGAIVAATAGQEFTFTTAQLAGLMTNISPAIIASGAPNKLRESMVNAGCTEPGDARKLGYWLREYKDRVAGGWKLVGEVDKVTKLASWRMRGAA